MPNHHYERLDENYKVIRCPTHDYDGKYTGKIIINLPAYFDENPEERIRLGWMKHITYTSEEIREMYSWDPQSQYLPRQERGNDADGGARHSDRRYDHRRNHVLRRRGDVGI